MADHPIPGVWYVPEDAYIPEFGVLEYEAELTVLYAPRSSSDHEPWISGSTDRSTTGDVEHFWPDLVEVYNPHPPTHQEWGVSENHQDPDGQLIYKDRTNAVMAIHAASSGYPASRWSVMQRQVPDWQEVDQ